MKMKQKILLIAVLPLVVLGVVIIMISSKRIEAAWYSDCGTCNIQEAEQ